MRMLERIFGDPARSDILREPEDRAQRRELHRLQGLVQRARAGERHSPEKGEMYSTEMELGADWVPPAYQLLELEEETGGSVVGFTTHKRPGGQVSKKLVRPVLKGEWS